MANCKLVVDSVQVTLGCFAKSTPEQQSVERWDYVAIAAIVAIVAIILICAVWSIINKHKQEGIKKIVMEVLEEKEHIEKKKK